nr:carbon-nitrogen hydrolase family protein [Eubacterium sp.]
MRIGAYQFDVTANIENNYSHIKKGILEACKSGVRLLVFPECAVTGYPPHCIEHSSDVDFEKVSQIHEKLQILAKESKMYIVIGTIIKDDSHYYNCAFVFSPDGKREKYSKRALWGWDKENFTEGQDNGVIEIDSLRVGIRICFEVRFPEYFR